MYNVAPADSDWKHTWLYCYCYFLTFQCQNQNTYIGVTFSDVKKGRMINKWIRFSTQPQLAGR